MKPVSTAVDCMSMVRTARICGSSISKESQPEAPHLGSVGLDGEFLHLVGLWPSCLKPSLKRVGIIWGESYFRTNVSWCIICRTH